MCTWLQCMAPMGFLLVLHDADPWDSGNWKEELWRIFTELRTLISLLKHIKVFPFQVSPRLDMLSKFDDCHTIQSAFTNLVVDLAWTFLTRFFTFVLTGLNGDWSFANGLGRWILSCLKNPRLLRRLDSNGTASSGDRYAVITIKAQSLLEKK